MNGWSTYNFNILPDPERHSRIHSFNELKNATKKALKFKMKKGAETTFGIFVSEHEESVFMGNMKWGKKENNSEFFHSNIVSIFLMEKTDASFNNLYYKDAINKMKEIMRIYGVHNS